MKNMIIDFNNMDLSEISTLIDYYCSDCCHSCDECLLKDFDRELAETIERYNKRVNEQA